MLSIALPELCRSLSIDLRSRFGRGFSKTNIRQIRAFYLHHPIQQPLADESNRAKRCLSSATEIADLSDCP